MTEEIKIDVDKYNDDGYCVVDDFLTQEEIDELKSECKKLVAAMLKDETQTEYVTVSEKANDYFLTSSDKIHFFFEPEAFDEHERFIVAKERAVCRLGYALHSANSIFQKVSFSEKIKSLLRQFGLKKPAVVQSTYIFKQPKIGAAVNPHQDASHLYTEPVTLMGLWFALEESTTENGCLWFVPGSHKNGVFKRFIRNPDPNGPATTYIGKPLEFDATKFVAVPAKPGALVLIHGEVIHKSDANRSPKSREIYTFHVVETLDTVYSKDNWVQPRSGQSFPLVYDDTVEKID